MRVHAFAPAWAMPMGLERAGPLSSLRRSVTPPGGAFSFISIMRLPPLARPPMTLTKLPITVTARTGVPLATTRQVCRRLRESRLIPGGRSAPRPRPRDIARIIIGLASDRMADVPESTRAIEALPLSSDAKAPPTAGLALESLMGAFVGLAGWGAFDIREGYVDVALDESRVTIGCRDATGRPVAITYAAASPAHHASRALTFPFTSLRALCGALL